jgi:thioredoxin reductase (NADPH)
VNGAHLLDNLEQQLQQYGGHVTRGEITRLSREDGHFSAEYHDEEDHVHELRARIVLVATGIVDAGLPIENWREAVAAGAVRLCPVCDGFDVQDKKIAVATAEKNPVGHALFMRAFSADVTLFERGPESMLDEHDRLRLEQAGVRYVDSPLRGVSLTEDMKPVMHTQDGADHMADVFYPMLGEVARSELAVSLGAQTSECAELVVDDHQCTTVPGLYAIGDVVCGLNQIAVAVGQAAVAATRIHNRLPRAWREARDGKR